MSFLFSQHSRILQLLAIKERTWKELKKELDVSDPVLAKHIKDLLKLGLISEEIDKKDRRVKRYKINEEGLKAINRDLVSFLLYVGLANSLKIELAELKKEELKKADPKTKPIFELMGNVILMEDAEKLREWLNENLGKLCLEAMLLGGDYLKILCKTLDLFGPALDTIILLKDGEAQAFRDYVLNNKDNIILQEKETIGRLKIKDLKQVFDTVMNLLKKDYLFHKTLLESKKEIEKRDDIPEHVKQHFRELLEYMLNVSKYYFERLKKSSPIFEQVCRSIERELNIEL